MFLSHTVGFYRWLIWCVLVQEVVSVIMLSRVEEKPTGKWSTFLRQFPGIYKNGEYGEEGRWWLPNKHVCASLLPAHSGSQMLTRRPSDVCATFLPDIYSHCFLIYKIWWQWNRTLGLPVKQNKMQGAPWWGHFRLLGFSLQWGSLITMIITVTVGLRGVHPASSFFMIIAKSLTSLEIHFILNKAWTF